MFKNILVAVDGSEANKDAVDMAVKMAKENDAYLCAMCVFDIGSYAALTYELGEEKEYMVKMANEAMAYVMETAEKEGVELKTKIAIGKAADSITDEAKNYDLVICGSHGRTGLSRALIGSVAEKIVRTSPCPVLMVRYKS
jgi:nucleotide-binding universal stress UspA family protein